MMNIQKRSLEHVSDTLKSFDIYTVYSTLVAMMTEAGVDKAVQSKILNEYQKAILEQSRKVSDAKDWIDTIISDIQ